MLDQSMVQEIRQAMHTPPFRGRYVLLKPETDGGMRPEWFSGGTVQKLRENVEAHWANVDFHSYQDREDRALLKMLDGVTESDVPPGSFLKLEPILPFWQPWYLLAAP